MKLLDQDYADFDLKKVGFSIPMLLAVALVTYISYSFLIWFMPENYPVSI